MITQVLANILPPTDTNEGLAVMQDSTIAVVPKTPEENTVCLCKCVYQEKVFSEVGAITDWNKNDKTSMLFKKVISADTVTIKLYKGATSYTITDNTYGTFYDFGTLTGQSYYKGFVADWNKIYNALGSGVYYFETTLVQVGVTTVVTSVEYNLQPYTDKAADGTVRIETYNTGTILSSDYDYSGIVSGGWYQSYRIKGQLMPKTPKLINDNYYNQENILKQIQDKIQNEYELETELLPYDIAEKIIYDNLLANKILISDYNVWNENVKRQIELSPTNIEKKYFSFNKDCKFIVKLIEVSDSIIKNNF